MSVIGVVFFKMVRCGFQYPKIAVLILLAIMSQSIHAKESCVNAARFIEPLKVLHLTFHKGCENEFAGIAKELGLDVTTWYIHDLPPKFFDGISSGSALYNIGHDRAKNIWEKHKDFFKTFDVILTSDTAPLSRIFLQNQSKIPLIIWICNRFDYCDSASLDCDFPDEEYYYLFKKATKLPFVTIIGYTPFELYYTKTKKIDAGSLIIKPCALYDSIPRQSLIPSTIQKETTFFLPPYHNETYFMNFSRFLSDLGVNNFCGRYAGDNDIKDFKAVIHLPYSWSNLAFFENIKQGLPYFIPSRTFFRKLHSQGNYFHPNINYLIDHNKYDLSEWYCEDHKEIFTYFDSWEDLLSKIEQLDYPNTRRKIKNYAKQHQLKTVEAWEKVFSKYR